MCCNSIPPPPDYGPLAQSSEKSAQIMADLADKQLAESTRQYDNNMLVAKPVVDAQLGIMKQTKDQGDTYFKHWQDVGKPAEDSLARDANEFSTVGARERFAGQAATDLEQAQANEEAQANRSMTAMGVNPNSGRFAGLKRIGSVMQSADRAGAMTNARIKADALGTAKRMDVAGLVRGMPGAATSAYSVATGAGNSATGNNMAPGAELTRGMTTSANMTASGLNMNNSGLTSILNSQTGSYNAGLSNPGLDVGGLMKGGAALYTAFRSDRRLKENIIEVGRTNLDLTLYEFNYIGDPKRYRGVMADEVEKVAPDAVIRDDKGFAHVRYGMLGIEMSEVQP